VTIAVLIGLGFGLGVALVLAGLRPVPQPLAQAVADLRGASRLPSAMESGHDGIVGRLIGPMILETSWGQRALRSVSSDLRVTNTTPAVYLSSRIAFALVAALWAPLTFSLMQVGGVDVGFVLPLWCSLALAPIGFLLPLLQLRSKAGDRRRTFRHALSAFLDVVSISLAGGRGVDSALHDAAESGHGWAFDELRGALLEARLRGETPWAGLARLGQDLEIPELGELAASASLAGSEGARVRTSLAAKARSLRLRGLTEIEAAAQSASERMSLPIVTLMVGFIIFIAYPAVDRVLTGL
jgi:Flp pilus assembly protein TadB